MAPFDQVLSSNADLSTVATVQGRDDTRLRCGEAQSPPEYQLQLSNDFCSAGTPAAAAADSRRLSESGTGAPGDLAAEVTRWVHIPGVGEWTRVRLPLQAHALELYLEGTGSHVAQARPPPARPLASHLRLRCCRC